MRGSVKKDPNGTWRVVYDASDQPRHVCAVGGCSWGEWATSARAPKTCRRCGGAVETVMRRRQVKKRGFAKKTGPDGADAWLAEQIRAVERGTHIDPTKETLREFVQEVWLPAMSVSPNTLHHYERIMRIRILPHLGEVLIQRIDVPRVQAMLSALEKHGGRCGHGLAPKSLHHTFFTLNKALNDARKWDHVSRNVLENMTAPTVPPKEMSVWTAEQMRAFLHWLYEQELAPSRLLLEMRNPPRVATGRRLYPMWLLAMTTGMRREELLGLRWSDIDWEQRRLSIDWVFADGTSGQYIYKRPKTNPKAKENTSRRRISLDQRTLDVLREWRKYQLEERMQSGPEWVDDVADFFEYPDGRPSSLDLVFRAPDGHPLKPRRITALFPKLAEAAGLPRITLHDVRHSYATLMLLSGVHPKIVSERLGHTNVSMTLDLYSWVLPSIDEEAADRGADLLFGAGADGKRWARRCADCRTVGYGVYRSAVAALTDRDGCPGCGCVEAVIVEVDGGEGVGALRR
jgi:integrase